MVDSLPRRTRVILWSFFAFMFSSNIMVSISDATLRPALHARVYPPGEILRLTESNELETHRHIMVPPPPPPPLFSDHLSLLPARHIEVNEHQRDNLDTYKEIRSLGYVEDTSEGESSHRGTNNTLIGFKIGALLLMGVVAGGGCAIPLVYSKSKDFSRAIPYINSFACGTFLGLGFFHLLPESLCLAAAAKLSFTIGRGEYNLVFPLVFAGFVLILIFERILLVEVKQTISIVGHSHDHASKDVSEAGVPDDDTLTRPSNDPEDCTRRKAQDTYRHSSSLICMEEKHASLANVSPPLYPSFPIRHISTVALLTALSLSIHSVFEGIVVGTLDDGLSIWVAALSICGHKWVAGFALAANCLKANMSIEIAWVYLSIFIISSPIGVLIGLGISSTNNAFIGIVDSIAAGTVLYSGCEILFGEFGTSNRFYKEFIKLIYLIVGASIILGLYILHMANHNHNSSDHHC